MPDILSSNAAQYLPTINQAAAQYGVPSQILQSVAQQESSFQQNLPVGPAGEVGIMQLTPGVYTKYGVNPFDPTQNIQGAAHYLSDLFAKYGNWTDAISHYNGTGTAAQNYATSVLNRAGQLGYTGGTTTSIGDAATTGAQVNPNNWLSNLIGSLDKAFPSSTIGTTAPPNYNPSNGGISSPMDSVSTFFKNNAITIGLVIGGGIIVIFSIGSLFNTDKIIEQVKTVAPLAAKVA